MDCHNIGIGALLWGLALFYALVASLHYYLGKRVAMDEEYRRNNPPIRTGKDYLTRTAAKEPRHDHD